MSFFRKLKEQIKALFGKKKEEVWVEPTHPVPSASTIHVPIPGTPAVAPPTALPPSAYTPIAENKPTWPAGAYEFQPGIFYVPYLGQHGGPFTSPKEAYEWMDRVDAWARASKEQTEILNNKVFEGTYPARSITDAEALYLYAANRILQRRGGSAAGNLFWDFKLIQGGMRDINDVINTGERLLNESHKSVDDAYLEYQGRFRPEVDRILARG